MVSGYQNGTIAQLLQAIIGQINFDGEPISNIGDILLSILEQTPYDDEPKSVLAELFLKLKDKLEGRAFTPYDKEPKSVIAEILLSILNETEYDKEPTSRIAELLLELKAELESYAEITVSGAIANFTTSVVKPLVNLKAYFEATQEAGTPTPQSPKAISGVSAVNVFHCHKNLYNYDESKILVGTTTAQQQRAYFDLGFTNCTLSFSGSYKSGVTPNNRRINVGKLVNGQLSAVSVYIAENTVTPCTLTYGANERAVLIITLDNTEALKTELQLLDLQIELGSTATAYEAYNGSTTLINLGGTYYGGYFKQDKAGHRQFDDTYSGLVNISDLTFNPTTKGGHTCFYADLPNGVIKSGGEQAFSGKCSTYTVTSNFNMPDDLSCLFYCSELYGGYTRILIRDDSASAMTGAQFTAYVTGQIAYEKANPQTIALPDGEPITAFNGVNNVWNDSGDTSVTYLAKIEDNLKSTAKNRAEVKAQKEKAKLEKELKELEEKETIKEPITEEVKEPTKKA